MTDVRRIVVIGAGFAGLSAARQLVDAGSEVVVLEARERVGGRVWSVHLTNGALAELGAEWVMPGDAELRRWAARFGIDLAPAGVDYLRREARGPGAASLDDQDAFLSSADDAFSALPPDEIAALTAGRFLAAVDAPEAGRAAVTMRLQGTNAIELDRVALRAIGEHAAFSPPAPAVYHRMGSGNQALAVAIADSLPDVRLGHRVHSIAQGGDHVVVGVEGGAEISATAAIVALPAKVGARLEHDPFLPEDLAIALRELPMGEASKLAIPLEVGAAPRAVQSAELPFWSWVASGEEGDPRACLTSFAGSAVAQDELGTANGDVVSWRDRLLALHPDLAPAGDAVMKRWGDDPLTLGSYAAWDNRSWDRMEEFQRMVGRIAFAGEHTAGPLHHGTMEGALRSGMRAAAQVLRLVG